MEPTYTLGSWIKARRLTLGLTQVQLASRAGCAAGTARAIESNDRRPGRGLDASLARALRLDPETAVQFLKVVCGELSLGDLPDVQGARLPGQTQLPSGVVTFLFTDVEGSTQRWEEHGEAMYEALARHLSILHNIVESHHGSVFKTVGDAVYAVFASAPDALAAAIAAQQALCQEDWSVVGKLRVRMALLTDSAQARAGDYLGLPPSRAARLVAAAHGCQIVMSLAIELAAARIRLFPPAALLGKLRVSLALLTNGAVDAPVRHQTLRSAIDWSYRLLDAREQRLLARIAVFAGHCTLEAIEAICYGYGDLSGELVDDVTALVTRSLLQRTGSLDGEPCFRMLETIREYALERLEASGEGAVVRRRHAEYFLDLVETAEGALHGPRQTTWLQRLTADHDNLRAVLAWSTREASRVELGLRLAAALWHFWEIHGHLTDGQTWLQRLLAAGTQAAPELRARALYSLASLTNDPAQASAMLAESLALQRMLGNQAGIAATLQRLGAMAAFRGDCATASVCLEESLERYRALNDAIGIAAALHGLGDVARYRGECDRALMLQYEALCLRYEHGNQHGVAWSLNNLAWLAYDQGQYDHAALLHRASYDRFCQIGDRWGIATALTNLGHIARQQGEYADAAHYLAASLHHFHALNNPGAIAYVLEHLAALAVASQPGSDGALRAARLFGAAQALRDAANSPILPFDIVEYRKNLSQAQSYLTLDAWNTAYAAGQALPTEQIITEVLTHMPYAAPDTIGPAPPPARSMARALPPHQMLTPADVLPVVVQYLAAPLFEQQVSAPSDRV